MLYLCIMEEVRKNLSVETLRGIAILLVVVGHVVGSDAGGGMKIDFPHPLRYLYLWIDYIQMPLFTAIAGWVYALEALFRFVGFSPVCQKESVALAGADGCGGDTLFLGTVFYAGHQ